MRHANHLHVPGGWWKRNLTLREACEIIQMWLKTGVPLLVDKPLEWFPWNAVLPAFCCLFWGTRITPFIFRSTAYIYILCCLSWTLTIEEWKTEQQLFAKAVSVNSSASFRRKDVRKANLLRVWSWLRINAGGVPNTCKSNVLSLFGEGGSGGRVSNT